MKIKSIKDVKESVLANMVDVNYVSEEETDTWASFIEGKFSELEGLGPVLDYHKDPENFVNEKTKMYLIKKIILRILRLYTTVQISFNNYIVSYVRNLFVINQKLLETIKKIKDSEEHHSKYFKRFEDRFYTYQQKLFRGSFKEVYDRQKIYIKDVKKTKKFFGKYGYLDIGFGRGEFLKILRGIRVKNIIGVDTNKLFVESALNKGYMVHHQDGIDYLENYNGKLGGVFAFQVVEHMNFEEIFDFIYLSYRKLEKGGIIIIEIPNIENVVVSSTNYYLDHTHRSKLPASFLESLFKFIGFKKISLRFVSPSRDILGLSEMEKLMYGYQDLAVIAYK